MCWNLISGAEGSGIIEEFRYPRIWKEFQYYLISLVGILVANGFGHGLCTPNEGINQRNLKIWADVANKICFGCT